MSGAEELAAAMSRWWKGREDGLPGASLRCDPSRPAVSEERILV